MFRKVISSVTVMAALLFATTGIVQAHAVVYPKVMNAPGEFQEFEFQGKTAEKPGTYAFPAYQTYADGDKVVWTGPSDAKTPASVVELKATGTGADAHGQEKPAVQAPTSPVVTAQPAASGASPMTTTAAYGGLLLGAAALLVALRRK